MAPMKKAPMKKLVSRNKTGQYRKIDYGRLKTIGGKKYDRTILRAADIAVKGAGDGRISVADAKMICKACRPTTDGRSTYDAVEKATMAYVRKNYKFTPAADTAVREFIAKMAGKQAARTKAMKAAKSMPVKVSPKLLTKPIRIGFLIGKDTDLVEDAKYVGDASFMDDMPDKYRVDPESKEYIKNCTEGTKGFAQADVAIPWYIHKKFGDEVQVDMIFPEEITTKRLKSNLCNYVIGYDVINSIFEGPKRYKQITKVFTDCGDNIVPSYDFQDFIYIKSKYMEACMKAGVPMAPTIFAKKGKRSPAKLLAEIKDRGWKTFVMKQSLMAFSLGFCKLSVEKCEQDESILKEYFNDYADCPEYVVQEAIEGFTRNWETRCFWFNGKFLYAIANKAAVSTEDGKEVIVTGDDIPEEFLENAKRIGEQALKILPQLKTPTGQPIDMTLIRTDVGCSDSQVFDKHTNWDPNAKTFFLNEIEYGGTTYFIRHLKEDWIPRWGELYVNKSKEIFDKMCAAKAQEGEKKRKRSPAPKKKPAKK